MSLSGSTIPFPATPEERTRSGDPRRSIGERYPDKAAFLDAVRREAKLLVDAGYLLAEDIELVAGQAARRFDLFAAPPNVAAAQ